MSERASYSLRISATNICNFNCVYCEPSRVVDRSSNLSDQELTEIIGLGAELGLRHVTWTGGEPTARKGIVNLVRKAKELGIEQQSMTTNGLLFSRMGEALKDAGLTKVNFSLDTMDREEFKATCGVDGLKQVIASIHKATELFGKAKFNAVVTRSTMHNVDPLIDFTESFGGKLTCRFLELVPCGQSYEQDPNLFDREFVPIYEILFAMAQRGRIVPVANTGKVPSSFYFNVEGMSGVYGLNPNYSEGYKCDGQACSKVRLNPAGWISNCTVNMEGNVHMLAGKTLDEKREIIRQVIEEKEQRTDYSNFRHEQRYYDFWRFNIQNQEVQAILSQAK
jgi:cyclic pyranopterin phosphate synthase